MKKIKGMAAAAVLLGITALASCGGGDSGGATLPPPSPTTEPTPTPEHRVTLPTLLAEQREEKGATPPWPTHPPATKVAERTPTATAIPETPVIPVAKETPAEIGTATPVPTEIPEEIPKSVAEASNVFGWRLYHQIRQTEDNIWLSPVSIHTAFALVYPGAAGETKDQLRRAMGYPEDPEETGTLIRANQAKLNSGENSGGPVLNIVNSIWGQSGHPFAEMYLETVREMTGEDIRNTDFAGNPEEASRAINEWVEKNTGGTITDMFPPGTLTPATRMALANAVYFKARWQEIFDTERTETGTFHNRDGTTTEIAMMRNYLETGYAEDENMQLVLLHSSIGSI